MNLWSIRQHRYWRYSGIQNKARMAVIMQKGVRRWFRWKSRILHRKIWKFWWNRNMVRHRVLTGRHRGRSIRKGFVFQKTEPMVWLSKAEIWQEIHALNTALTCLWSIRLRRNWKFVGWKLVQPMPVCWNRRSLVRIWITSQVLWKFGWLEAFGEYVHFPGNL